MVVIRLFLLSLVILISPTFSSATPINVNTDFSAGLTGWSASGDVAVTSGIAVISDPNGGGTLLQSTNTGPGSFTLTFDLLNALAPKGNPGFSQGVFADIAAGTLYFSNSALNLVNLAGNSNTALFDANSVGVVSLLQVTSLGAGWFQYSLAFTTAFNYVTPVLDLFAQDFVTNSALQIDNVKIEAAAVPEPATLLLLAGSLPIIRRRLS